MIREDIKAVMDAATLRICVVLGTFMAFGFTALAFLILLANR